jgi:hypothetical protein
VTLRLQYLDNRDLRASLASLKAKCSELESRILEMEADAKAVSDEDDEAHRLLDVALGEAKPGWTSVETVAERLPRLFARLAAAESGAELSRTALRLSEEFARGLHQMVQDGAGCCGEAIGRGGRIEQVAEEIAQLAKAGPDDCPHCLGRNCTLCRWTGKRAALSLLAPKEGK